MRNLLTDVFKRSLRQEYLLRLFVIACFMVSSAFGIALVSLLPTYFLTRAHYDSLERQHALLQASVATLTEDASRSPLSKLTQRLAILAEIKTEARFTEALIAILSQRPKGISIQSFAYQKISTKESVAQLKISGVAADRDALIAFKKALEQDARFERIDLPISNLAREKDINFDVTLTGVF